MAYDLETELEALPELEDEFEEELEDESELEDELEDEAALEGEGWLGALGNIAGSLLGESEDEYEAEDEYEDEYEISPIRKIYPDAMMEHLGELAAEAESEQEAAEHFLPLVGMAASKLLPVVAKAVAPTARKALPKIAKAVTKATPHLTRGIGKVAKVLHRNPQTRHLLRAVPSVARSTVGSIAKQAAQGRPVTPKTAVRTLARHTRRVLGSPRLRALALRNHHRMDRRFHHRIGTRMIPPHWRYAWAPAAGGVSTKVPGAPVIHTTRVAAPTKQVRVVTQAGKPVQQVRYVGGRVPAPKTQVAGYPGVATHVAAPRSVAGPPCPTCGTHVAGQAVAPAPPAPRYGQCVCQPCPACGGS